MTLGWREWIALPALGIATIKAKVDTGARTSALHAFWVEPYSEKGAQRIRFGVHPRQQSQADPVVCDAEVCDRRAVRDSGGHRETRWVIVTELGVAGRTIRPEITLTNRDTMLFRVLLGRTALKQLSAVVDPARSFLTGGTSESAADHQQPSLSPTHENRHSVA